MPEGNPFRAWLFELRRLAHQHPLPGRIRINVGVTRRGAASLQDALQRDAAPVNAIDCHGRPTRRLAIDGLMFEWLTGGKRRDKPKGIVGDDPQFAVEVWSADGNRLLDVLARARQLDIAKAAYEEATRVRPTAYVMLRDRARVIAKRPPSETMKDPDRCDDPGPKSC